MADACLCFKCFSLLYLFQEFKKTCLKTESKIRDYIKQRSAETNFVSLQDIFVEEKDTEATPLEIVKAEPEVGEVTIEEEEIDIKTETVKAESNLEPGEIEEDIEVTEEIVDLTEDDEKEEKRENVPKRHLVKLLPKPASRNGKSENNLGSLSLSSYILLKIH